MLTVTGLDQIDFADTKIERGDDYVRICSGKDPMIPDIILYHAECADGTCAAMIAKRYAPQAQAIPVHYQTAPPALDYSGKRVLIVDFSYPRDVLIALMQNALRVQVLDHHKTAQEQLRDLPGCYFDLSRSGAMMTWHYFNDQPEQDPPWIVEYVQDRDLWRNQMPYTQEINLYLSTLGYNDLEIWEHAAQADKVNIAQDGRAMLALKSADTRKMKQHAALYLFCGHTVPVCCAPVHHSDVGGELAQDYPQAPFSVTYYQRPDGMYAYSLRARKDDTVDVSSIARQHGGGGHAQAAGFAVPHLIHIPLYSNTQKPAQITVNAHKRIVNKLTAGYDDLIDLAFPESTGMRFSGLFMIPLQQREPGPVYTITYRGPAGTSGTVAPGDTIRILDGMIFNVHKTSNA